MVELSLSNVSLPLLIPFAIDHRPIENTVDLCAIFELLSASAFRFVHLPRSFVLGAIDRPFVATLAVKEALVELPVVD